jgi:dipeptidase E
MGRPTIIAIGGGKIRQRETEKIDQYMIAKTGSSSPRVLFIPTASLDDEPYIKSFETVYGGYGCNVDTLRLVKDKPALAQCEEQILSSDLVYIGGGNTLYLYNMLRFHAIDEILKRAWEQGVVMAGLSAGCIIWHERGLTDSVQKRFVELGGLAWVPRFVTPHFLREPKRQSIFRELVAVHGYDGLAIDDNCAVVYEGKEITETVSLGTDYNARLVYREAGKVRERVLEKTLLDDRTEPWIWRLKARWKR